MSRQGPSKLIESGVAQVYIPHVCRGVWGQVFIQDFEMGGGKQDGSRMIVACETHACLLGESGGMPPQENFEFTSSQIASDAIWDKISKHFDDTYVQ